MKLWEGAVARTAVTGRLDASDSALAPPLAPGEPAIDRAHLARMTFGEARLEREVLDLFDRQAGMLLARMTGAAPAAVAALAHTLIGSARGVGAWKVAEAAEAVERAAGSRSGLATALRRLSPAVAQAHAAIGELLQAQ
jgi:HPt (histidine-containing phosphotransfer) domain-containing protein